MDKPTEAILKKLSKEDARWRNVAFNICKDESLCDDLVQEMYLTIASKKPKRVNSAYVYRILLNKFLNHIKEQKNISIEQFHYIECRNRIFEPDDGEQALLDKFGSLSWRQQELILESYDKSLRQIQDDFPMINYGYAYRQIRDGIQEVLGDKIHKYKNTRNKRK
jgi:DNA-directed RNA polymerase specialized sigma24 family protein